MKLFKVIVAIPALVLALGATQSQAKTCDLAIEGNDAMQYNTKELTVEKGCTEVKLTLKHTGKAPKAAMGHNWVLTTEKNKQDVINAGAKAGPSKDYFDMAGGKVLAHTKMVGGGESDSVTFKTSVLKKGESFVFVCTFPGHAGLMTGKLVVK